MTAERVLIIDDEENMRHMLGVMLTKAGYAVSTAEDGMKGLAAMEKEPFAYVLCDIRMPVMDGLTFLQAARARFPDRTYLMMSAFGTVETAVEAMKMGAYDYISKPFKTDEVLLTLRKAAERERLKTENALLRDRLAEVDNRYSFGNIIARSEAMARVFDLVQKVAAHKTTVLITGESGTGKELIARAIHAHGPRKDKPLVSINCGGIPEQLLESELFGFKRGAFTDAVRDRPGRFEEADQGTIFLDEIGELPLNLQVKLLRVLQEEEIMPLGGKGSKKIDVRVIVATSRHLQAEVKAGRFREDLYYRINVVPIHLPPLRQRKGDVALLIGYFITIFNRKLNKTVGGPSSEAMTCLLDHSWPGNVRELENVVERAVLLATGPHITPAELPEEIVRGTHPSVPVEETALLSIKGATRALERSLIAKALERTGGNRSAAARILEISRPILLAKIRAYGIE